MSFFTTAIPLMLRIRTHKHLYGVHAKKARLNLYSGCCFAIVFSFFYSIAFAQTPPTYTTYSYTDKYQDSQSAPSIQEYPTPDIACTASAPGWPNFTVSYQPQWLMWPYSPTNPGGVPYSGSHSDMICAGINSSVPYYQMLFHPTPVAHCPSGYFVWNAYDANPCQLSNLSLVRKPKALGSTSNGTCNSPQVDPGTQHPIHTGTGNKYLPENDYRLMSDNTLSFTRYYNSQNSDVVRTIGIAWRHTYDRAIVNATNGINVERADGKIYFFSLSGGAYTAPDSDVNDKLTQITDGNSNLTGWKYTVDSDGSVEQYDSTGKLVSIQNRSGILQSLTYSDANTPANVAPKAGLLIRVIDSFGRHLDFNYDSLARMVVMTDPAGATYQYHYDINSNLVSVTYPDTRVKGYRYSESAYSANTTLPSLLTGIVDENSIRYATYYYDALGRAYKEQHAGGVDQYQIGYSSDGSHSAITDPLGTTRTTNFTTILGVVKVTSQSQPGGAGCSAAANALTYDVNGNVASRTDFNGNKTTYTYDLTRNLETSRTEASGTPQARTITTQWHSTYRLPILIAEPLRKTTLIYDPSGNQLNKTTQTTTDTNGSQGFSAQLIGIPRTWSYTYNNFGQVLTVTGPRTDVVDKTTYSYDPGTGNLLTVSNAASQITTLSNYDANGRVGTITDPNGMVTNLTYYPRGWLKSKAVSSSGTTQTTNYFYDGVGQLTSVTLPDNSTISYIFDPAHRLTNIADSLGNTITYTLDAMGNRISEQVNDPSNVLVRQTTRIYDALNRLQQVTGATQ